MKRRRNVVWFTGLVTVLALAVVPLASAHTSALTASLDCNGNVTWKAVGSSFNDATITVSDTFGNQATGRLDSTDGHTFSGSFTISASATSDEIQGVVVWDDGFVGGQPDPVTVTRPTDCTPPPPPPSGTANFTPGYWKTHAKATQAWLPLFLGAYEVNDASTASSILSEMGCGHDGALNCMAGMLLAAELNLAQGGTTCIVTDGVVGQATTLLEKYGYNGPGGSFSLSSSDQTLAMSLHDALSNYNIDGVPTC
jgi:hypothetical protein